MKQECQRMKKVLELYTFCNFNKALLNPPVLCVFAQQPVYSGKEFKPLHGLTGLWKIESPRGAINEEREVK